MNYPFTKKKSPSRFLSLALVLALVVAMLSGCSLLPSSGNNTSEPSEEATENIPNIVATEPATVATEAPTEAPTTAPKENVAIVKEQLSIRQNPSTGSRVRVEAEAGDEVVVSRIDSVGTVKWALVTDSNGVIGWVIADMLDLSNVTLQAGSSSTPSATGTTTPTTDSNTGATTPTTSDNTNATTPTVNSITGIGGNTTTNTNGKMGVVTASELNIRSSASQSGDLVGSYAYGTRVSILESSNGWGRTDKGWISLSYVYMDGDVGANAAYGTVTATQLRVRSGPGTNYEVVKTLNQNERVQVLQQIKVGNTSWGYVSGGWASMDYISLDGGTNTGNTGNTGTVGTGTGVVTGNGVNVRVGAGQSYQSVGTKNMGDVVTILEVATVEGRTWGRMDIGWICMDYVRMN